MADRQISELVEATAIEDNDLLVLQQGETAKKAKGKTVKDWVYNESVENFVIVSDTEPTTERNHIWVDPSEEDVVIPTMDDLQGLTAEDISYDGSATHTSGSVGEAISELSSDIDGLDAGDVEYDSSTTYASGSVGSALATQSEKIDDLENKQFSVLGTDYEIALGTWESSGFVSWNKRIANRYAIDIKKGDIITVLSPTLRWEIGISPSVGVAGQNTGWIEPSETVTTVISQYDGVMMCIFAKVSGDTMDLTDYDATVHIYNTFAGHLVSKIYDCNGTIETVDKDLKDIANYQEFTLFDKPISLTTFADIPVEWQAGTYDFYASAFISSDTDVNVCRMALRSSSSSDLYVWDNVRNGDNARVITVNADVAVLRIYAGTTYQNSLNDTLSVSSMIFRLRTPLSNRLDEIETNIQTEIAKTEPLTERTTGILSHIKGKYMSHLGVAKTNNIIIPSQSLADLERTIRLGFNAIEINVRKTSDNKYVCIHGENGNFGPQFEDVNGNSVSNVSVASMTLADIKSTIRFKSKYARYKTAPFTLEEMLYECKKLEIIPLIEYQSAYTDEISIIESIMGKSDYMLATYTTDRSDVGSNAPMFSWLSITNPATLVAKCNASGGAYIAGLNVTADAYASFTENDWKSLVNAVHDAGYAVSCAYGSEELKQTLLKCGFDIINTSNNVNEIETGNALNIPDTVTFAGFTTTGTVSGGVLSLGAGQKIAPTTTPDSVFLGAGSLHIVFDGEITVTMGGESFGTFQSDGSQDTWLSTVYEEAVPTFEITSSGNTTVKMLSFKSSAV